MKKSILFFIVLSVFSFRIFSQIDDILKKVPGVGDILIDEAVTTSIKDAYPSAYWLGGLDKKMSYAENKKFSLNLEEGYYKFRFNTFCLHAGTYAPTEGTGYLIAPLKGSKADLIKSILGRYMDRPEIDQKDVQMLIWGIEAGQKFSNYDPAFQFRITPLLKPEDIAMMEVEVKDIAYDLLPDAAKEVLNLYRDIRGKLSDANSTYEDVERLAVKTGIAPLGKGSRNIEAGVWTSIGDGVYMRSFPETYKKSNIEIYIPDDVIIEKDASGNILSLDDGINKIILQYESGSKVFSKAVIRNHSSSEETSIENNLTDYTAEKNESAELVKLIKKSFGKKKSKRLTGESLKTVEQLKRIEWFLSQSTDNSSAIENGKTISLNALNSFISDIESGNKKGGGRSHKTGLGNINGLVHAPANTSSQRLGNGGPEGGNGNEGDPPEKDKDCKVKIYLSQVNENEIPKPDLVYTVTADVSIEGTDEKCQAEEIVFTLFDVSKEKGRFMNDKEKYDDVEEDLQMSDMNSDYQITKTTAKKSLSGKGQSLQIHILCRDYGAFGKLKASVKVKGKWYDAEADGSPDKFITLPLDLNNNKIADGWEKEKDVLGKPAEWDEETDPAGHSTNGDGMTNYEEFRGFKTSTTSSGTPEHTRMNPKLKEIFVIDNDGLLPKNPWQQASGVRLYFLKENDAYSNLAGGDVTVKYRWVDFCQGYAKGNKYALNIIKVSGLADPYNVYPWPSTALAYALNQVGVKSPKQCLRVVVFPDRVRYGLEKLKDTLSYLINLDPPSGTISFNGNTLSKPDVNDLISFLSGSGTFELFLKYQMTLSMIHEIGHGLGLPHHTGSKKEWSGDEYCPMRYIDINDQIKWVSFLNTVSDPDSFTQWQFCSMPDNCWSKISVNDR